MNEAIILILWIHPNLSSIFSLEYFLKSQLFLISLFRGCSDFISVAVINMLWPKQCGGRRSLFQFALPGEWRPLLESQSMNLKQHSLVPPSKNREEMDAQVSACCLVLSISLFYKPRTLCIGIGASHSGLSLPTSINKVSCWSGSRSLVSGPPSSLDWVLSEAPLSYPVVARVMEILWLSF